MAVEVVMPRLGWTMETGTIAEWLKKDGDAVQAGDIIFTVESDKAVQEVEALGQRHLAHPALIGARNGGAGRDGAGLPRAARRGQLRSTSPAEARTAACVRPPANERQRARQPMATGDVAAGSRGPRCHRATAASPPISPRARRVARGTWRRLDGGSRAAGGPAASSSATCARWPRKRPPRAAGPRHAAGAARRRGGRRRPGSTWRRDMPGQRITRADVAAAARARQAVAAQNGHARRPIGTCAGSLPSAWRRAPIPPRP